MELTVDDIQKYIEGEYRKLLISWNAFENDAGIVGEFYQQREYVYQDLLSFITGSWDVARDIKNDIDSKVYTQILNDDWTIRYEEKE